MGTLNEAAAALTTSAGILLAVFTMLCPGASVTAADSVADKTPATPLRGARITVFAGAASQPATSEAAKLFTEQTGIKVECSFGGSGAVLNQIRVEHYGDLYIPGSDDYMDKAEKEGLVDLGTRRTLCRLQPVICVPKGNPKRIKGLQDLTRPGLRLAIGDPKSVCLGSIAKAALEKAGIYAEVSKQIVTFASDCQQVASLIRLDEVDAAIGYDVFQRQSPDLMDSVPLEGAAAVTVPAGVVSFSKQKDLAQRFADYLAGPQGREVFARHGYTVEQP
jgi:molybdate transport system substrate-binding protein